MGRDLVLWTSVVAVWVAVYAVLEAARTPPRGAVLLLEKLRLRRDEVVPRAGSARVALGYNVCLDAVVNVFELFDAAGVEPPMRAEDHADLGSKAELAETFLLHFAEAAGGERAVTDKETFAALEEALERAEHHKHLGGNAAIMAVVLARDYGFKHVLLGGQVGPAIESLLPKSIETAGLDSGPRSLGGELVDVRQDETHIILEYPRGATWGSTGARAARANRFIISRDVSNSVLAPLEPLNARVVAADKHFDVLVAAGFHMLDSMHEAFRAERLAAIRQSLAQVPADTRIHFELASVGDAELLRDLARSVLPLVDSLGLNEQELAALLAVESGAPGAEAVDLGAIAQTVPDVGAVCAGLEQLIRAERAGSARQLRRVHFHSYAFHVVVQDESEGLERPWPNMAAAVAAGSVKASERACNQTALGEEDITLQLARSFQLANGTQVMLEADQPVVEWSSEAFPHIKFALAPVLTCNTPVQTVGLGDSISASALAYQA